MALPDTFIPVLTGKTAERFCRMAEENLKRQGTVVIPDRESYERMVEQLRENSKKQKDSPAADGDIAFGGK